MNQRNYSVRLLGEPLDNCANGNVDVEVELDDGRRFCATFFTLANIEALLEKNRQTGECLRGRYFWATNMILIETVTADAIASAIDDLIEVGELERALALVS